MKLPHERDRPGRFINRESGSNGVRPRPRSPREMSARSLTRQTWSTTTPPWCGRPPPALRRLPQRGQPHIGHVPDDRRRHVLPRGLFLCGSCRCRAVLADQSPDPHLPAPGEHPAAHHPASQQNRRNGDRPAHPRPTPGHWISSTRPGRIRPNLARPDLLTTRGSIRGAACWFVPYHGRCLGREGPG